MKMEFDMVGDIFISIEFNLICYVTLQQGTQLTRSLVIEYECDRIRTLFLSGPKV
jgi:type III secretory pathway component EscR